MLGTGLSKNLDDLGAQGEWPKHPGLLDWLAVEFMESGWDIKHLVKLIVLSNVYANRLSALMSCASVIRTTVCSPGNRGSGSMPKSCATTRFSSADCWPAPSVVPASNLTNRPAIGTS